jgi:hypothetical protein
MIPGYAYQVDHWQPDTETWVKDGPQASGLARPDFEPPELAARILRNWTADYPAGSRARVTIWNEDRGARVGEPVAVAETPRVQAQ